MTIELKKLPPLAIQLLINYDGWLLGGTAISLIEGEPIKSDIDIMVPHSKWHDAVLLLTDKDVKLNTFGGYRFTHMGYEYDVWPDSIERLISFPQFKAAYHAKSDMLLRKLS